MTLFASAASFPVFFITVECFLYTMTLHVSSHLILIATCKVGYYSPHFIDEQKGV